MRRRREQEGQIIRKSGRWYLRVYESRTVSGEVRRVRAAKLLGDVTTRGKHPPEEIKAQAKDLLREVNGETIPALRVLTLSDFMTTVYFPTVEREQKKPSTIAGYKDMWRIHLQSRCAQVWLKDVKTPDVQQWLNEVQDSRPFGRRTLLHIRSFLSGIFSTAIRLGYFAGVNPAREARVGPGANPPKETYAYTLEEVQSILALLPEPAATVVAVAAYTGLRLGEIQGLLWENYQDGEIRVTRSIWQGEATAPKTRKSCGTVPVIRQLQQRLELHRLRSGNPQTGPMFATSKGTPEWLNNVLGRQILPVLNHCAVCHVSEADHKENGHKYKRDESRPRWHGWHAFRRGLGSNLYALGTPEKVIQDILRHANLATTMTYYVKVDDSAKQKAMDRLEDALPAVIQ